MTSGYGESERSELATEARVQSEHEESKTDDDLLLDANSDQQPTVSVVMPTLNEEDGISECIERIKTAVAELGVSAEIVISDSSTDRTPDIAAEQGAIVVEPDEPGYGYAYRYAFDHVRGEYIVMGDADTTYDFEEVPTLVRHLVEEDADVVMGSRLDGDIKPGAMPALHQYVGNPLLTKFLNVFYDAGVSDAHSGFRVFTQDALATMDLNTTGMEFASEMIMDASVKDLQIEEVPITYHEREGDATLDSFRDGWRHVRFMLLNAPSYLFTIPGTLLTAFGAIIMAIAATGLRVSGVTLGTHSMIAGSLFILVGYQVAFMGVFTTVAGDPIKGSDSLTTLFAERLRLEQGVLIGGALTVAGSGYALSLLFDWVTSGFTKLPLVMADITAFTAIVLGVQTIFGAFCLSAIAERV